MHGDTRYGVGRDLKVLNARFRSHATVSVAVERSQQAVWSGRMRHVDGQKRTQNCTNCISVLRSGHRIRAAVDAERHSTELRRAGGFPKHDPEDE